MRINEREMLKEGKMKKVKIGFFMLLLLPLIMAVHSTSFAVCGDILIIPVDGSGEDYRAEAVCQGVPPQIIDAWTTDDPFGNPTVRENDFTIGSDILAFVTQYDHSGGFIPRQYIRAYTCDSNERVLKTCVYDWTVGPLPEGCYLLINYYDPVEFKAGTFDWAVKVGDLIFGYPDPNNTLPPECVTLHE
jgi:hypothetical protein